MNIGHFHPFVSRRATAIVETATVKDASGNVVELKNLQPDGTIGAPAPEVDEAAAALESRG